MENGSLNVIKRDHECLLPNIKFGHSCLFTCPPAIDKVKLNILKTRKTGSCIQKTSTHSLVTTTPTQQLHSTRFPSPAHSAPRPLQHPAQIYVLCPCTSALRTSINIIHAIYAGEAMSLNYPRSSLAMVVCLHGFLSLTSLALHDLPDLSYDPPGPSTPPRRSKDVI